MGNEDGWREKKVDVDYVVATPVYELKYYINSCPIYILKE